MNLGKYRQKRRFGVTPEPDGKRTRRVKAARGLIDVVQKHNTKLLAGTVECAR
jgi:hypothetical protein